MSLSVCRSFSKHIKLIYIYYKEILFHSNIHWQISYCLCSTVIKLSQELHLWFWWMVQYKIFVLCEHWCKHSVPAFLFFFNQYMENILCNVCKYCFWHPHPRLLHNRLLFGTLPAVSFNCPGGTGVLCWRRKTFTDRAFQMVSAVNIAIEGESQPLCTYITKKGCSWERL